MSLRWLPNAISIMRIFLVAPILFYIVQDRFAIALTLFVVAGFSDGLDGFLAKRFDWHTRIGALLDPIADKVLVAGTFVVLAWSGQIPIWLAVLVIARDLIIIAGATAFNFLIRPVEGEPTRISKLNTALQLMFILFVLARAAYDWPAEIAITVIGASIVATVVISGMDYILKWARRALARDRS